MFKNVSGEGGLPGGQNLAPPAALRASSAGLASQESSWLGLLSVLSRPALSFVSKYLPGLGGGGGATSGLKWQPGVGRGDVAQGTQDELCASAWSWLSDGEGSLRQLGIEPGRNSEASPSRTFFAWEMQSSWKDGMGARWGSFQEGDPLSAPLSQADLGSVHKCFCAPQSSKLTKEECRILVSGDLLAESAGASVHKEEALVNAGPGGVQNGGGAAADHDNGYYSLEEEHGLKCHTCSSAGAHVKQTDASGHTIRGVLPDQMADKMVAGRVPEDGPPDEIAAECHLTADEMGMGHACQPAAALCDTVVKPSNWTDSPCHVTEDDKPGDTTADKIEAGHVTWMAAPQCRNNGIAFIMGCPCSDDDSQSEADSAHDDGFDSSGSSDLSSDWSSSDEDEEGGEAADEETTRLLALLCCRDDPYNPQNFSARLHTGCAAAFPNSASAALSPSSPPSPPSGQDTWDDSGGEADEAESLLLLASLTPSDPYSLLNFQAPLSTGKARTPSPRATRLPAAERMDGDFTQSFTSAKKVRFSDVVEEFFIASGVDASEEEDRRGPWEEVARDRGRFLRRCQEAELSLAYCLQPEHRRRAYRRINGHDAD